MNNQVKLIDPNKVDAYIEQRQRSGDGSEELWMLQQEMRAGTFDPDTPLVPTIKPGDKVRITDAMDRHYIGKEDIVTRISGSSPYSARLNDSPGDWPFSSLEVVE